jgi:hypothetical protein
MCGSVVYELERLSLESNILGRIKTLDLDHSHWNLFFPELLVSISCTTVAEICVILPPV